MGLAFVVVRISELRLENAFPSRVVGTPQALPTSLVGCAIAIVAGRPGGCLGNWNCGNDLIVHNLATGLDEPPAYFQPWGCARCPEGVGTTMSYYEPFELRAMPFAGDC